MVYLQITDNWPGPFTKSKGVSVEALSRICESAVVGENDLHVDERELCVGFVLEVYDCVTAFGSVADVIKCLVCLLGYSVNAQINVSSFFASVKRLKNEVRKLKKNGKENECLERMFCMPGRNSTWSVSEDEKKLKEMSERVRQLEKKLCKRDEMIEALQQELRVSKELVNDVCKEKKELYDKLDEQVRVTDSLREKLSVVTPRNVNKKIARRESVIEQLRSNVVEKEEEVEHLRNSVFEKEEEVSQLRDQLEESKLECEQVCVDACVDTNYQSERYIELQKRYESVRKAKWYRERKCSVDSANEKLTVLNERVRELENEKCVLEEKMSEFVESDEVKCFKGGKYTCEIRRVYQELIGMGVSASKCEAIVRCVIEGMGKKVDRLPKEFCAERMAFECRALAWMQLSECLESENVTLMTDGTTKYGKHYESLDVRTAAGECLTLGVRDVASGDAESLLNVLREILNDVAGVTDGKVSEHVQSMIANMKNTMSDRASAGKKFNELLYEYRRDVLPRVMSEWKGMSEDEREKHARMNHFFCGMHYVVGLAEQASVTLYVWENMIFGETVVGAGGSVGKNQKSESGTLRMIRTVCKSVQDRGCEKSGKPVWFREFVRERTGRGQIPLAPFKGNRFNIIFHNGAGVYALYPVLCEFFDRVKDENLLMKAVESDLHVDQYVCGVRALGIIDKCVTVPLWRAIESEKHVGGMNVRFERLNECLHKWAKDASGLMKGEECLYEDISVNKDWVYESLMKECEHDCMTRQVLELLLASFYSKTRKLLEDQLSGGENADMSDERIHETASVPTTNVGCERDFGMFDYLMRERPNASTCAMEGVIMFRRNKTGSWLKSLGEEKMKEYVESARASVKEQVTEFRKRMIVVRSKRAERLREKQGVQERKDMRDRVKAENLTIDIGKYGGLWNSVKEVDEHLSMIDESERRVAVEGQLKFRKYVLKCVNVDGCLNLSKGGKVHKYGDLLKNLKVSVSMGCVERETVQNASVSFVGVSAPVDLIDEEKVKFLTVDASERVNDGKKRKKVERNVPFVYSVDDFLGKVVERLNGNEWQRGCVLEIKEREGVNGVKVYSGLVKMKLGETVEYDLMNDYKCGMVRLVSLENEDLVGQMIEQRWLNDGSESWWRAKVLDVVNERSKNPMFVVDYEENDDDDVDGEWRFSLFEDYVTGDLRVIW